MRHQTAQSGLQQERLHAHIGKACNGCRCRFGMQRGQHQMAGQRRVNGNMCRFRIADFADHDDIRILPHKGPQRLREGQANGGLDLRLVDASNFIFNRVFDGENFTAGLVEQAQRRSKCGGLAAACGAGDDNHAMGQGQKRAQLGFVARAKADTGDVHQFCVAGQQADGGRLTMGCGHGCDTHVNVARANAQSRAPVLRQAAFGNIQACQNFDA